MRKILEFKEYNSKIVSADKAEREEDLKLDQIYLGFCPTIDIALIPLCNTRFTRARIKSHVYTTEWTVYHSTYHVKRYNKTSTNFIYNINDKMSDTNMRKRKTGTELSEAGRHRDVD